MDASIEIIFVGTRRGLEAKVVPALGYRLEFLDVLGLKKKTKMEKARAFVKAISATFEALKMVRRLRPDGVMGSGGYSSGPAVLAAGLLGIKTAILEQNALPGLTKRLRAINAAVLDTAEYLTDIWDGLRVIHQTGRDGFEKTGEAYKRKGINVELHDFIDDMALAYAGGDLVICGAGATSIAEITALGIPAILIPYPFSADGHQEINAASLVKKGAAIMIRQDELTGNVLGGVIRRLFTNPVELRNMRG